MKQQTKKHRWYLTVLLVAGAVAVLVDLTYGFWAILGPLTNGVSAISQHVFVQGAATAVAWGASCGWSVLALIGGVWLAIRLLKRR